SSSLWPLIALPCPIDSFCLNGGTCKYYEAVGELVCQCAEGYKGQRCENKDIYNLGSKSSVWAF
ncbi:Pro-neuregulin-2, membrane-bound, partial [Daphnia magna]